MENKYEIVDVLNNEDLKGLLSFEDKNGLQSVHINKQYKIEEKGIFISAELFYNDEFSMTVPFVWYVGEEWLFTPWDWQSYPSNEPEDIESIKWRVNDTDKAGIILNGLPRIFA